MGLRVEFSKKFWAVKKRIENLPKFEPAKSLIFAILKKDALTLIKTFKTGIRTNAFGLEKLQDGTIKRKKSLGMERPETPLYAKGDDVKDKSYINMLRIRKIKNGFIVRPSIAMHHSRRIKLRHLWEVHEFGTIIKRGNALIRIPARPALLHSLTATLKKRSLSDNTQRVKRAISGYIKDSKRDHFDKEVERLLKGLGQFEPQQAE